MDRPNTYSDITERYGYLDAGFDRVLDDTCSFGTFDDAVSAVLIIASADDGSDAA